MAARILKLLKSKRTKTLSKMKKRKKKVIKTKNYGWQGSSRSNRKPKK